MAADLVGICVTTVLPVSIVGITMYYKYKAKLLAAGHGPGGQKELEAVREERRMLEARIQNLESIVCSVDLELNGRLNRLLAQQSQAGLLPAPSLQPEPRSAAHAATVAVPASATPVAVGSKIAGRYTIERELGRGGMGAVYLALDHQLGERVALKVVTGASMAGDPGAAAERFRREVAAARKITHPNVIRIHDLIEDGANQLLSMEYVDGMTLQAYLGRVGALRVDEARPLLGQICDGLDAAHAAGIVHRDLKPGNVLIDSARNVKVIDFGLAKASFMAGMTATGLILGTPDYMAPEQVRGLSCDARTDVYSLGALAYHALVGRPPFTGETPIAVGFAHVNSPPPPPRTLRPELSSALESALLKALEKDPSRRFDTAAQFKRALA